MKGTKIAEAFAELGTAQPQLVHFLYLFSNFLGFPHTMGLKMKRVFSESCSEQAEN